MAFLRFITFRGVSTLGLSVLLGLCVAVPTAMAAEGDACPAGDADDNCRALPGITLFCNADTGLCMRSRPVGGSCTRDRMCETGLRCRGGTCREAEFPCDVSVPNPDSVCPPGYRCAEDAGVQECVRALSCLPLNSACGVGGINCCTPALCTAGRCLDPPWASPPPPPPPPPQSGIPLLEPIGNVSELPTTGQAGFGLFFTYFNLLYPWVVGLGAAIAVLMGLIGGIQIMTAGADSGRRDAGINRFKMSVGGLLLLLFSSLILNLLNPTFFR